VIKPLPAAFLCAATFLSADIRLPGRASLADSALRAAPAAKPVRYGLLWLEVEPDDAQISLDGNFLDVDVWLISMAPGRHEVLIRKDGFRPVDRSIGIGAGESLRLAVQLEKDSLSAPMATVPQGAFPGKAPSSVANPQR
jgi:hypothetical protein